MPWNIADLGSRHSIDPDVQVSCTAEACFSLYMLLVAIIYELYIACVYANLIEVEGYKTCCVGI